MFVTETNDQVQRNGMDDYCREGLKPWENSNFQCREIIDPSTCRRKDPTWLPFYVGDHM